MPLIHLVTNVSIAPDARGTLCARLSKIAAKAIGKPETYVMAIVQEGAAMIHAGAEGPAAFVDVRSIGGLGPKACGALSEEVSLLLRETLHVDGERVYLNFTEVPAARWGHDGRTFG